MLHRKCLSIPQVAGRSIRLDRSRISECTASRALLLRDMRVLWIFVGLLSTAFGIAGVVLPLVPTTPFVLVAAFAFARSSPRLHAMLLSHSTFGRIIENWNRGGCIDRRSKAFAMVMLVAC